MCSIARWEIRLQLRFYESMQVEQKEPFFSRNLVVKVLRSIVQNSRKRRKSLGKWRRARTTRLCTVDRKTSPAFGYAQRQELIINRDVTCESGLWDKPMSHLQRTVLEMFLLIMC